MKERWPRARFVAAPERTAPLGRQVFDPAAWRPDRPVRLVMIGTDFEVRVWEALLAIPMGRAVSYRGALPPRPARRRQPRRLPLGPHPQARPDRWETGRVAGRT
jgi:hypothetical protein